MVRCVMVGSVMSVLFSWVGVSLVMLYCVVSVELSSVMLG
jgi:hypothetical protein